MDLNDLKMYKYLEKTDLSLANQVKEVYGLVLETINGISKSFSNYTMHDMNHGLRVALYMEQLAFGIDENAQKRMQEFNAFEITLMILSAILHDIGMNISKNDEENIKKGIINHSDSLTYEGVLSVYNNDADEAVKEIIRRTHAARIEDYMIYEFNGITLDSKLRIEGKYPYSEDIVEICKAHGEDYSFLREIRTESTKSNFTYNAQYIAALLRIADYLDLDQQRTPILWFSLMGINGFSREEWEKHFTIQNTTKLKEYIDGKLQIYFDGRSANAKIHRMYLSYIDGLKEELENADTLLNTAVQRKDRYKFNISTRIDDRVKTEGFTFSDLRLNLDYSSITELLMGKNIYGDSRLGLREIIQNSIDACKLIPEIAGQKNSISYIKPAIDVICSKENNTVTIKDTGIGMTLDIVKKHFLNIGKSYYKSDEFLFKNSKYNPIGQYGIGFLSCFLLSDSVTVRTKYYNDFDVNQIELLKNSEYVVTTSEKIPNFMGTEIVLEYDKFFEVFESFSNLEKFLKLYFFTDIEIKLTDSDEQQSIPIKNTHLSYIIDKLSKDKIKYNLIDCSKYSNVLDGTLLLKDDESSFKLEEIKYENKKNYLYIPEEEIFQECVVSDLSGNYFLFMYPNISNEEFDDIYDTTEGYEEFHNEAKALAIEQDSLYYLYVKSSDIEIFESIIIDDDVDDSKLLDIFNNSEFNYYKNFLWGEYLSNNVFIYNKKCVIIKNLYFNTDNYYGYRNKEMYEMGNFAIYNKDILIPRVRGIRVKTPYDILTLFGIINCKKLPIKLDVSRNYIIDGRKELNQELNKVLFEYIKEHISTSDLENGLLEAILNNFDIQ